MQRKQNNHYRYCETRYKGTKGQRYKGTKVQRYNGTMIQWVFRPLVQRKQNKLNLRIIIIYPI